MNKFILQGLVLVELQSEHVRSPKCKPIIQYVLDKLIKMHVGLFQLTGDGAAALANKAITYT